MIKRTCTVDGCVKPHVARGHCKAHYNKLDDVNRHAKKLTPCTYCGTEVMKGSGGGRKHGAVCSNQCRTWLSTPYCILPADHWARWYGKSSAWKPRKPKAIPKMQRECEWCGAEYETHQSQSKYCAEQCAKRASKLRRRAREHDAPGMYSWAQVMRLFMAADKLCAYCDDQIEGQPDPDHVIPLSRGGRNDMSNIVACCRMCNSDKCDMTLEEWAGDRARLGKAPRRYVLPFTDARFRHLMEGQAKGPAWRHMQAA